MWVAMTRATKYVFYIVSRTDPSILGHVTGPLYTSYRPVNRRL